MSYSSSASSYDLGYFVGFFGRDRKYRRMAIEQLDLKVGDTVIDLCTGTGLNLPFLSSAVGETGKVIGVDSNDAMLKVASSKIKMNITLLNLNAEEVDIQADAILCTYGISVVPSPYTVILRALSCLKPGGRLVIMDLYYPKEHPILVILMKMMTDAKDPNASFDVVQSFHPSELNWIHKGFVYVSTIQK